MNGAPEKLTQEQVLEELGVKIETKGKILFFLIISLCPEHCGYIDWRSVIYILLLDVMLGQFQIYSSSYLNRPNITMGPFKLIPKPGMSFQ